jgi:3-deoxy-manno-octulosonate cytidylyltransferase (CMP-KDO synthetase)
LIKATGIIPARYRATRFPGKLLAVILGKPMIQWVYEKATTSKYLERVIIATDDDRIYKAAQQFGADVEMTSPHHNSGTERVAEIAERIQSPIFINIQGDEPLIRGDMIDSLVEALQDESTIMATLAFRSEDFSRFKKEGTVKVVVDHTGSALYFSRAPIPFNASGYFLNHIGIYGYKRDFLLNLKDLPRSPLETTEKLEQLKVLENGYKIKVIETSHPTLGVDYPEDIARIEEWIKKGKSE